jgi:hypothetical protein
MSVFAATPSEPESWTEYGVRSGDGYVFSVGTAAPCAPGDAEHFFGTGSELIGRTVTASPWLPVPEARTFAPEEPA